MGPVPIYPFGVHVGSRFTALAPRGSGGRRWPRACWRTWVQGPSLDSHLIQPVTSAYRLDGLTPARVCISESHEIL